MNSSSVTGKSNSLLLISKRMYYTYTYNIAFVGLKRVKMLRDFNF